MRTLTLALTTLLAIPSAAAQLRNDMPPTHYFGIPAPQQIGPFKQGRVQDYTQENPELGVGVEYSAPGHKATVYIYNGGLTSIPEGPETELIRSVVSQARRDISLMVERGIYRSAAHDSDFSFQHAKRTSFLCSKFSLVDDSGTGPSFLCATGFRNHIVKIRLTGSEQATQAGIDETRVIELFLSRLADAFWGS